MAIAKKQICENPEMKNVVEMGIRVQYIYISEKKLSMVFVNSCE